MKSEPIHPEFKFQNDLDEGETEKNAMGISAIQDPGRLGERYIVSLLHTLGTITVDEEDPLVCRIGHTQGGYL